MSTKLSKHNFIIFCGILFIGICCKSCKKDYPIEKNSLNGDTSIFVGTWNWIYSEHDYGWCDPPSSFETITPFSSGSTFQIRFLENGVIRLFKNGSLVSEYRIYVSYFQADNVCSMTNSLHFGISFNNDQDSEFFGCVNSDTLASGCFPGFLYQAVPGCESFSNYFIKG